MADLPRLNGVIRALEAGQHALTCFTPTEISGSVAIATSKFDGCVFEMEHQPWDGRLLRDCLQYMLNRAQIVKAGSVAPGATPMARVPVNGVEMAQWQASRPSTWAVTASFFRTSRRSRKRPMRSALAAIRD